MTARLIRSYTPTYFASVFLICTVFCISFLLPFYLQPHLLIELKLLKSTIEGGNDRDSIPSSAGDLLFPPINSSSKGRIAWFKNKLPEFKILESNSKTRRFDQRVNEFLGCDQGEVCGHENKGNCTVRFFMTWISPASLFGKRELLSLETVFKAHPKGCVVILSRTLDSDLGWRILGPLVAHGFRVLLVAPDLAHLFEGTPALAWLERLKDGKVDPGMIPLAQNLSNLLRFAIVYKYGGVYLDTDFIILKDVSKLRNSIGAQTVDVETKRWTRLNNALLIFDKGHPLLLEFMEEFASHFNGNRWGYNGPYLVSRVIERVANKSQGFEFTILPPIAFYPVDWVRIDGLFHRPKSKAQATWANLKLRQLSGEAYGVHLWNKGSRRLKIEEGSIIGKLISDHCIICHDIYDS